MHVHLCVASWLFSLHLSCLLLRPTVLLPALPDVYLRVQREVQVNPLCDFRLGTVATSDHETPLHNKGLEAYRQLCRRWHAGTRGRNLARLQAILQWNFGATATETLDSLASWESEIEEWEQLTGERMADSIKLCVLDAQAPKELSTYLRLHTKAEETFATVKRKIQDYLQAMDPDGSGFRREEGQEGQRQAATVQGWRQAEQGQRQATAGQEPTQGS